VPWHVVQFQESEDGRLRFRLEMVFNGVTKVLNAVKISDKEPRRISDPDLLHYWNMYKVKEPEGAPLTGSRGNDPAQSYVKSSASRNNSFEKHDPIREESLRILSIGPYGG